MATPELLRGIERLVVVACTPLLLSIGYQLFRLGVTGEMKITTSLQKRWSGTITAVTPGSLCFLLGIALGIYVMASPVAITTSTTTTGDTKSTYSGFGGTGGQAGLPLSIGLGAALDDLIKCQKAHPGEDNCQSQYNGKFKQVPTLEDLVTINKFEFEAWNGSGVASQQLAQMRIDYQR